MPAKRSPKGAQAPVEPQAAGKMVERGDLVQVHYRGMLEDDSVFDSSDMREPLAFEAGAGDVIDGFDDGVMGMRVGETRRVVVPPEAGYGAWRPELLTQVERGAVETSPVPGMAVRVVTPDDDEVEAVITEVADDMLTLDLNHPLAGKILTFEITVVSIEAKLD